MSDEFRKAIRPPTTLTAAEWMGENVRIVNSERAPFFDVAQFPFWRDPINQIQNPETKKIICVAPTGSGKSTMAEGLFCYIPAEDPGPLMYASQTDTDASFWVETRLKPAMKKCKALDDLWSADRHATRKMEVIFPHMQMIFGGANKSNFQEKSCRYLYGDEVWEWDDGLIREFFARHHERWNRKGYLVSQGGVKQSEFYRECEKANWNEWHWACPNCDTLNLWDNNQIKVDFVHNESGEIDALETKRTARMQCVSCGHQQADTVKHRRALADLSQYVTTKRGHEEGSELYRFPRSAMWWVSWGDIWLRFHEAAEAMKRGIIKPFIQYKQKDEAQFWDEEFVIERTPPKLGDYRKADISAEKIEGEVFRSMAMDRGKNHFWYVAIAWNAKGEGHVLSEGYLDDERKAKEIETRLGIATSTVVMDVSWEFDESMAICIRNGWTGIRGDQRNEFSHKDRRGNRISKIYSRFNSHQVKGSHGKYFFVSSKEFKDLMHGLRMAGKIVLPDDVSQNFLDHMEAERREESINARTGEVTYYWKAIKRANHLLDCLYYCVAVAYVKGVFGIEPE